MPGRRPRDLFPNLSNRFLTLTYWPCVRSPSAPIEHRLQTRHVIYLGCLAVGVIQMYSIRTNVCGYLIITPVCGSSSNQSEVRRGQLFRMS